jgi:hypothetical protein
VLSTLPAGVIVAIRAYRRRSRSSAACRPTRRCRTTRPSSRCR